MVNREGDITKIMLRIQHSIEEKNMDIKKKGMKLRY